MEEETNISRESQNLLEEYHELVQDLKRLPPVRHWFDHAKPLQEGANPVNIRPYRYPAMQKSVIEELIKEMMHKGIIQMSSSPFASLVFLVKKKIWGWRLFVDYRMVNKLTIKNRYLIPLMEDLFDELGKARIFSKLDLKSSYHQIRVKEEDRGKTAFQTHAEHYEFLVMSFGLSNAPATFQNIMNHICRDYLRNFVIVFFL